MAPALPAREVDFPPVLVVVDPLGREVDYQRVLAVVDPLGPEVDYQRVLAVVYRQVLVVECLQVLAAAGLQAPAEVYRPVLAAVAPLVQEEVPTSGIVRIQRASRPAVGFQRQGTIFSRACT